jgi:hypothetical protein
MLDIGLSIFEHDLIVHSLSCFEPMSSFFLLGSEPHRGAGAPTMYNIENQFIRFSNGNPHPHAREHRTFVMNTECEKPSIRMDIIGENLVRIQSHPNG